MDADEHTTFWRNARQIRREQIRPDRYDELEGESLAELNLGEVELGEVMDEGALKPGDF
jgi:hypothetical protein